MSEQQNVYILEVVLRYNLQGVTIPHVNFQAVGSGNIFSIYHAEVPEQQLGTIIARLEEAKKTEDIIAYFCQQKTRTHEDFQRGYQARMDLVKDRFSGMVDIDLPMVQDDGEW